MKSTILSKLRKLKNRTTCVFCRCLIRLLNRRKAKVFTSATQNQPVSYVERRIEIPRGHDPPTEMHWIS